MIVELGAKRCCISVTLGAFTRVLIIALAMLAIHQVNQAIGFHLSLGQRLLRSAKVRSPQASLTGPIIRPLECRNQHNQSEVGICMFSIDCMQSKGVPLSVCKHNYFVGTCCKLPMNFNDTSTTTHEQLRPVTSQPTTTNKEYSNTFALRSTDTVVTTPSLAEHTEDPIKHSDSSGKPDSRYMISSMSLFPTSQAPISTTTAQMHPTTSGESARNVDGSISLEPLIPQKNLLVVSSNLDALHPQTRPQTNSSAKHSEYEHKKNEYEVVREESSFDMPTTINSAHSPSSTQQQFNVINYSLAPSESNQQRPVKQQNNVYLVDELQKGQQSVVFANNHKLPNPQKPSQLVISGAKGVVQQVATIQEPLLSSVPQANITETKTNSTTVSSSTSSYSAPVSSASSNRPSETPHLDLVSTHDLSQSTTPFTTSLSTALLPNVSSHPYAPTELPPNASTLVSSSHSPTSGISSKKPYGQLYNSQTAEADSPSRPMLSTSTLMASTKLVGASSPPSQFIPGLANLQSALLSHIPFKLATGLTSYLQAAMKPVGGRPLISSNTAPALQYQQQLANANKLSSMAGIVKFPSASSQTPPMISSFSESTPPMQQSHSTGSSLIINSPSKPVNTTSIPFEGPREAHLLCGRPQVLPLGESRKRVGRIVGGNQSLFGQWPWMVSLRQWRKGAFLHKCGAALLNEKWAITAAHCVENVQASDLLLRLGEFDVSNQEEPYPYIERRVKTVVAHPSFDPKTFEYDLALLKFAEPVKYERNIVPVCVPAGNDSYVDRMATVIGWGRLYEDGPLPDVIQHVDVPIITNKECEKMYKNAGYIEEIPDMFICAGISKGGRDSCEGDSGGPLTMVDHDGRSYLVGIISWGIGCALPSQPGVYTRITAFSGWINQIIDF